MCFNQSTVQHSKIIMLVLLIACTIVVVSLVGHDAKAHPKSPSKTSPLDIHVKIDEKDMAGHPPPSNFVLTASTSSGGYLQNQPITFTAVISQTDSANINGNDIGIKCIPYKSANNVPFTYTIGNNTANIPNTGIIPAHMIQNQTQLTFQITPKDNFTGVINVYAYPLSDNPPPATDDDWEYSPEVTSGGIGPPGIRDHANRVRPHIPHSYPRATSFTITNSIIYLGEADSAVTVNLDVPASSNLIEKDKDFVIIDCNKRNELESPTGKWPFKLHMNGLLFRSFLLRTTLLSKPGKIQLKAYQQSDDGNLGEPTARGIFTLQYRQ